MLTFFHNLITMSESVAIEWIRAIAPIATVIVMAIIYWKKIDIKELKKSLLQLINSNTFEHNEINNKLSKIESERHVAEEIRKTIKDAITYSDNCYANQMLDIYGESLIAFARDILEITFAKTTFDLILTKWINSKNDMLEKIHTVCNCGNISTEYLDGFINYVSKWKSSYLQEIQDIYNDNVNNKDSRFETETLRYSQKIANEAIKYMQKNKIMDKKNEEYNK